MLNYTKRSINLLALFLTVISCTILIFLHMYLEQENKKNNLHNDLVAVHSYDNSYNKQVYFTQISLGKLKRENRNTKDLIQMAKKRYIQSLEMAQTIFNNPQKAKKATIYTNSNHTPINIYKTNPWRIQIPKLQLDAPIAEGTTPEALRRTVGHFESSSKWNGNVALAGHNRGYRCNFFQEIKKLQVGDKIIYQTSQGKREYKVIVNKVIEETDWSYVQPSKTNKITLITCEENRSQFRRCIQAIELKEGGNI